MTMPIRTFQDILDALEQNPDLAEQMQRHLLSQRLLELPEVVARLTERVDQLTATVAEVVTALAELTAAFREFVRETNARFEKIETDIAELRADVNELKEGQAELRRNQETMRADIDAMRADIDAMRVDMGTMRSDIDTMRTDVDRISGTVARLDGTDYEHKAAKILPRVARRILNLRRQTSLLHHDAGRILLDLPQLDDALDNDIITPDQLEDLQDVDIIVAGSPNPDEPQFVIAEASITVQSEDVQRVHRRAQILRLVTEQATIATVIGVRITDPARQEAKTLGITFIQTDEEGQVIRTIAPESETSSEDAEEESERDS